MNPAPSVILFSVLSGMGFGLLAYLGFGVIHPAGWPAFFHWALGYGLAVTGLLAATFHLGNPKNAWRAFSQWRTSWLSREAWGAVTCLFLLAPQALSDWLGLGWPRGFGILGAALALFTVLTTAMIYTQIRAVPRWHHPLTPIMFISFAVIGGAILSGQVDIARWGSLALSVLLILLWKIGDGQFQRAAQSMNSATGLVGQISIFERGHTAGNYLLREMIYVVGRKHAERLRWITIVLICLPALIIDNPYAIAAAAVLHLLGALTARWLFFAQAEHVVGLFYGERGLS